MKQINDDVEAFNDLVKQAGKWVFAGGLKSIESSTTVDGRPTTTPDKSAVDRRRGGLPRRVRPVVAALVHRFGDIDIAEEGLADALVIALERWPRDGVPPNAAARLTRVALNGIHRRYQASHV